MRVVNCNGGVAKISFLKSGFSFFLSWLLFLDLREGLLRPGVAA